MDAPDRPYPEPTPVTAPFWDGLREHVIRIQYSPSAARYVFYPRLLTPGSLTDDLEWREIDGLGSLYTFTVAHRPTAPFFASDTPPVMAVVEWDVGARFTTELVDVPPSQVSVGMRVRPVFCDYPEHGVTLLRYTRM